MNARQILNYCFFFFWCARVSMRFILLRPNISRNTHTNTHINYRFPSFTFQSPDTKTSIRIEIVQLSIKINRRTLMSQHINHTCIWMIGNYTVCEVNVLWYYGNEDGPHIVEYNRQWYSWNWVKKGRKTNGWTHTHIQIPIHFHTCAPLSGVLWLFPEMFFQCAIPYTNITRHHPIIFLCIHLEFSMKCMWSHHHQKFQSEPNKPTMHNAIFAQKLIAMN